MDKRASTLYHGFFIVLPGLNNCPNGEPKMKIFNRLASMIGLADAAPTPSVILPSGDRTKTNEPTIAVVNKSTMLHDVDIKHVVDAIQIQVDRDFEPVWDLGANLIFVSIDQIIPEGAWVVYLLDNSDQQGALGYHDITNNGLPLAKVFAGDDMKYNLSWSVTLSHEILEMILDPWINYTVFVQQTNTTGVLFSLEVADACEDDSFGYKINDVLVSDFVYPSWFMHDAIQEGKTQFSHMKSIANPFEIAEGGYIGYFEVGSSSTGWQQATGPSGPGQRLLSKINNPDSRIGKRSKINSYKIELNKFKK